MIQICKLYICITLTVSRWHLAIVTTRYRDHQLVLNNVCLWESDFVWCMIFVCFSFGQGKLNLSLAGQYSVNFIRVSRTHLLSLFEENALSHPFLQFMVT